MPCDSIDGLVPVVEPSAALIGDVIIGAPHCCVGPCANLRGDFGHIERRTGANVQDTCVVRRAAPRSRGGDEHRRTAVGPG